MHSQPLTFRQYIDHEIDGHPNFQLLWQSIDFGKSRLAPDADVAAGIDRQALAQELHDQHRAMIMSGPGYSRNDYNNWDHVLDFFAKTDDNIPNILRDPLSEHFRRHVQEADLGMRMAAIVQENIPDIPGMGSIADSIYATAGQTMAYVMASQEDYEAALYFLAPTLSLIDDGLCPHQRDEALVTRADKEEAVSDLREWNHTSFYPSHGIGERINVLRFQQKLEELACYDPGMVDMEYSGEPGSLARTWHDAVLTEEFGQAMDARNALREQIENPLRELGADIQVYTAARLLAMHILTDIPDVAREQDRFYFHSPDTVLRVSRHPGRDMLSVFCAGRYHQQVESVLHQDRYSLVFPRFGWKVTTY